MKKLLVVIGAAFTLLSCDKEAVVEPQQSLVIAKNAVVKSQQSLVNTSVNADSKAAKASNQEFQTLIRKWNEWIFKIDIEVSPFFDTIGNLQYLAQPYASGVFMLAPGVSPDPVVRIVTISLRQYQYVFIPLVGTVFIYSPCDPNSGRQGNQTLESLFIRTIKEPLNGPAKLTLLLDGVSILPKNQNDLRANSGAWSFDVHPSWTIPCAKATTTYADGYWAKVPLTIGTHTLLVGGEIEGAKLDIEQKGKSSFSSMVSYTLFVKE